MSLASVTIVAALPDGTEELVFQTPRFRGLYVAGSSYTITAGGDVDYSFARAGGWPGGITTITTTAVDEDGEETVEVYQYEFPPTVEIIEPLTDVEPITGAADHLSAALARVRAIFRG